MSHFRWNIERKARGIGFRWSVQEEWRRRDGAEWHWLLDGSGSGTSLTRWGARRAIQRCLHRYENRHDIRVETGETTL